jgi:alkanesulfonate monooxygenase SsuD/methylene tetrahydromethanopterin reductase-like flavin-dependent oxidoreductase (luciferase family)
MQVTEVLNGIHDDLADQLNVLAASATIQIVQKTVSSAKYLVVYDNTTPGGQTVEVISGDPDALAEEIQTIIDGGGVINAVANTFSASFYLVVWT